MLDAMACSRSYLHAHARSVREADSRWQARVLQRGGNPRGEVESLGEGRKNKLLSLPRPERRSFLGDDARLLGQMGVGERHKRPEQHAAQRNISLEAGRRVCVVAAPPLVEQRLAMPMGQKAFQIESERHVDGRAHTPFEDRTGKNPMRLKPERGIARGRCLDQFEGARGGLQERGPRRREALHSIQHLLLLLHALHRANCPTLKFGG